MFQWFTSRRQHRLEEDKLSLEIRQLSELVRDSADSVRHRLPGAEYEFYPSSPSTTSLDFDGDPSPSGLRDGAEGDWSVADGVLRITATKAIGWIAVRLVRYRFEDKIAGVIQGKPGGGDRTLRVACEVRAAGGHATLVFMLKNQDDPPGAHVADEQRVRIRNTDFLYVEKWFTFPAGKDCYLRIVGRSWSQPGTQLHVRNLVVGERLPA